jgi:hypothetical protein
VCVYIHVCVCVYVCVCVREGYSMPHVMTLGCGEF